MAYIASHRQASDRALVTGTGLAGSRRLEDLLTATRLAQKVWDLLGSARTFEDITDMIADEFHLPGKLAVDEVRGYIEMFNEFDMVAVTH